ncbi:unnamed protein product [marine sediment metagenome]|uniref:Uncharacterized protein n=1 Tax=marine sediment metagenome TaxID=412755 RepID=X1AN28_9ZZZZ
MAVVTGGLAVGTVPASYTGPTYPVGYTGTYPATVPGAIVTAPVAAAGTAVGVPVAATGGAVIGAAQYAPQGVVYPRPVGPPVY